MSADKLQQLIDRQEISDAMSTFFFGLDKKDWDLVCSVLTDPFTLARRVASDEGARIEGIPTELGAFKEQVIARNGGFAGTLHMHPNQVVTIDGDEAHITSYLNAPHFVGDRQGECWWASGFYEVDVVRDESVWKLKQVLIDVRTSNDISSDLVYKLAAERLASDPSVAHRFGEPRTGT